jgi:hypothetical protein
VEELEKNRDALLQSIFETVLDALEDLSGEEKNKLYQRLRLEVTPSGEGYEVSGAFCTSGLTSLYTSQSTKQSELGFRALLIGRGPTWGLRGSKLLAQCLTFEAFSPRLLALILGRGNM